MASPYTFTPPPENPLASICTYGPRVDAPIQAVILDECLWGALIHFDRDHGLRGRSVLHTEPNCRYCACGLGKSFKSYAAAWSLKTRRPFLLELTKLASRDVEAIWNKAGRLRGMHVELKRATSCPTSRVVVRLLGWSIPDCLPPAFSTPDKLDELFGRVCSPTMQTVRDERDCADLGEGGEV